MYSPEEPPLLVPSGYQPAPLDQDPKSIGSQAFNVADDQHWQGSVLLADEIWRYSDPTRTSRPLIKQFEWKCLQPASYNLRLGELARIGDHDVILKEDRRILLPPHQVAILSTHEELSIPRFLIGRWSIKVKKIYEGVLWTGGPQVDPGWQGRLFCPVYNLSERAIPLTAKEPFFTIDFSKTTAYKEDELKSLKESHPESRPQFSPLDNPQMGQFDVYRIQSAPYAALHEVQESRQFRATHAVSLGLLFAAIGAIVAAVTIFTATSSTEPPNPNLPLDGPWFALAMGSSLASIILAVVSCAFTWSLYHRVAQLHARPLRHTVIYVLTSITLVAMFALVGLLIGTPWK